MARAGVHFSALRVNRRAKVQNFKTLRGEQYFALKGHKKLPEVIPNILIISGQPYTFEAVLSETTQ